MRKLFATVPCASLILLLACSTKPPQTPAIGEAYAGPATLILRREITPKSPTVATVNHGERLAIIRLRRSFVFVRTRAGVEGWTDVRQLLTSEEMADLKNLEQEAKSKPSQGVGSTYELLNVHTTPDRRSPSFLQVKEGEKFEVVDHRVTPRVTAQAVKRKLVVEAPPPTRKAPKKEKEPRFPKPPMPPAPKPPANWLEMSKRPEGLESPPKEEAVVPRDEWSLIRTASGRSGWVLTRRIYMAIPDEVAQYAEGRRITSYFSLGDVRDEEQVKHHWLWTTVEQSLAPYDFDGFRVFIWSLRRHRYETAYRERNLKGFFPVRIQTVEFATRTRKGAPPQNVKYPGFTIQVEADDGVRYWRSYAFIGNIVRFAGEVKAGSPGSGGEGGKAALASAQPGAGQSTPSIADRLRSNWLALRKRIFNR